MSANYLTFDVEDWFHSHNLRGALDKDSRDNYELRVVDSTHRVLDLLDEHGTIATFFVLGDVADRAPGLVEEIEQQGHELASHGYDHEPLTELSVDEIRMDIERSVDLLSSLADQTIQGYRAPSFTITEQTLDILAELGLKYDSSSFPVPVHDRYGSITVADSSTFAPVRPGLTEVQLPLLDLKLVSIPWAGGGYFRFLPYSVFRRGVKRISRQQDFVFYLHPWELDPDQPKVTDVPLQYRKRHYTNIHLTERRLNRLLTDFDWRPIRYGL
jgi:polysaccharide deacetylase family protein (PEP-CTERM system associated)